jgi:putative transposase
VVTPCQKEQVVDYLVTNKPNISHSKACKLVNCSRTTKYYNKKMPTKDANLHQIIQSVLGVSRKGREKVIVLVQKSHPHLSASKIRRVYEKGGFALSKKLRRRIKDNPANPIEIPLKVNQQWAMDFMSDVLENGVQIRTLNIIDHANRKCVGLQVRKSIPSSEVINILESVIKIHGKPLGIRTDNGPEFRSKEMQQWLFKNDIKWVRIQKGKPQQNAIIERFNRTFREDILDAYIFKNIKETQQITDCWVTDYNEKRPHQALNYKTPNNYAA